MSAPSTVTVSTLDHGPVTPTREPVKRIDAVATLTAAAVSVVLAGAGFWQGA
jgi:hypothetical protein